MGFTSEWWEKSRQIQERLPAACWLGNLICETLIVQSKLPPSNFLHYIALGTIHVLRNQDLGFSDPLPFVITFSTERNRKLRFSDPSSPFSRLR